MAFEMTKTKREIEIEGFNSIYFFEFGKSFTHSPEKHDFWEMVYVDSGEINAVSEGTLITLSQGEVIFHRPMESHSHISNRRTPNNMLVISFTSHSAAMDYFDGKVFRLEKPSVKILSLFTGECRNALSEIPSNFEDKSPLNFENAAFGSCQLMECYFVEFLYSLIRSNDFSVTSIDKGVPRRMGFDNSFSDAIEAYLNDNIYSTLTLDTICKHFSISKPYLCRLFRDATGDTIIDRYIKLKTTEAKKLIREDELNITEIAYMLGYSSIHHFSRAFKKETGFSPLSYKRSIG